MRDHRKKARVMLSDEEFWSMYRKVTNSHRDEGILSVRQRWCLWRDRSLLLVLYRCGLRVSEATGLRICDLLLSEGTLLVNRGKTGGREVGIPEDCLSVLEVYRDFRVEHGGIEGYFLSVMGSEGRWLRGSAGKVVSKAARLAGIERSVYPHLLRHTMALQMAREGLDLVTIQRQLGHANAGMTGEYLAGLDSSSHIEGVRRRNVRHRGYESDVVTGAVVASETVLEEPQLVSFACYGY